MAEPSLPMCSLDEAGMGEQRARYARIAEGMTSLERTADAVRIELGQDFDRATLQKLVEVESQCCPFFRFVLNDAETELTISVDDPQMLPALEAIGSELGSAPRAR
jgi:hypothetical protein